MTGPPITATTMVRGFLAATCLIIASASPASTDEISSWVRKQGYPFEVHEAATEDGRLLGLFRLPRPGAPAVLMMHGILDSAWGWVMNTDFKALGFQIYDAGYDVWLGNNRGNGFSERWASGEDAHRSDAFWNFSFHELGRYDLPALIGAVISSTGQQKLAYVAHSQGSMQFFAASSMPMVRQLIADRVSVFIALSPIAWLGHLQTLLLQVVARLPTAVLRVLGFFFPHGFLENGNWRKAARFICTATAGAVCKITVDVVCGTSSLDPAANIDRYTDIFPFGTSFKNLMHFKQGVKEDTFRQYDYGDRNIAVYGQALPPRYNLSSLAVPTALLIGESDLLADEQDVDRLISELAPTRRVVFSKKYPGFSHVTWMLGSKEAGYYTADVLRVLRERHALQHADLGLHRAAAGPDGPGGTAAAGGVGAAAHVGDGGSQPGAQSAGGARAFLATKFI